MRDMQAIWEENREAMLTLSSAASLGSVHGTLRGPGAAKAIITAGGLPVHAYAVPHSEDGKEKRLVKKDDITDQATAVQAADGSGKEVSVGAAEAHSLAATADAVFHLPLAPGAYTITVTAPGAQTVEKQVVVPDSGDGVEVHVELVQDEAADALTGVDSTDIQGGVLGSGFPYEVIAGRGAAHKGAAGNIMEVALCSLVSAPI
jgi:hypothetical protein